MGEQVFRHWHSWWEWGGRCPQLAFFCGTLLRRLWRYPRKTFNSTFLTRRYLCQLAVSSSSSDPRFWLPRSSIFIHSYPIQLNTYWLLPIRCCLLLLPPGRHCSQSYTVEGIQDLCMVLLSHLIFPWFKEVALTALWWGR